ncbi:MAG: SGNH/GDSL hydrolase family protein [Chloroflexi bacterium]|nr:SGNH/GDSL hydrolase family protein [Chloroflexota bacterium]
MNEVLGRILLVVTGVVVSVVVLEAGLRVIDRDRDSFYMWPPNLNVSMQPVPDVLPGIDGPSLFSVNSQGIRGDELGGDTSYRILALGGSTTENGFLDQSETWPQLLQRQLNERSDSRTWVGNAGKSGLNSRHHVVQMRYLLPELGEINAIVMMVGINDLTLRLGQDSEYDESYSIGAGEEGRLIRRAFSVYPVEFNTSFYKRLALWGVAKKLKAFTSAGDQSQEELQRKHITWRANRQQASGFRDRLPDMASALDEYAQNLRAIAATAEERSVRLILLTQPAMWQYEISEKQDSLLWFGGIGDFQNKVGGEYYSVAALSQALSMYNETLLDVCRDTGIECIDVASSMPGDAGNFYDDVHFTEKGAESVAGVVAEYMSQNVPRSVLGVANVRP